MIGGSVAHLCYITRRVLFGGRQIFAGLNYRTFLDRKVTKRDKKGTKPDEILPFWEKISLKMSTGLLFHWRETGSTARLKRFAKI
jgi:hypothetical protein